MTIKDFNKIPSGTIFASGIITNSSTDIYIISNRFNEP